MWPDNYWRLYVAHQVYELRTRILKSLNMRFDFCTWQKKNIHAYIRHIPFKPLTHSCTGIHKHTPTHTTRHWPHTLIRAQRSSTLCLSPGEQLPGWISSCAYCSSFSVLSLVLQRFVNCILYIYNFTLLCFITDVWPTSNFRI